MALCLVEYNSELIKKTKSPYILFPIANYRKLHVFSFYILHESEILPFQLIKIWNKRGIVVVILITVIFQSSIFVVWAKITYFSCTIVYMSFLFKLVWFDLGDGWDTFSCTWYRPLSISIEQMWMDILSYLSIYKATILTFSAQFNEHIV